MSWNNDGSFYEGTWVNGEAHGFGRFITRTRDIFVGQFVDGQAKGKCKLKFSDGSKYIGEVENFNPHGIGNI